MKPIGFTQKIILAICLLGSIAISIDQVSFHSIFDLFGFHSNSFKVLSTKQFPGTNPVDKQFLRTHSG